MEGEGRESFPTCCMFCNPSQTTVLDRSSTRSVVRNTYHIANQKHACPVLICASFNSFIHQGRSPGEACLVAAMCKRRALGFQNMEPLHVSALSFLIIGFVFGSMSLIFPFVPWSVINTDTRGIVIFSYMKHSLIRYQVPQLHSSLLPDCMICHLHNSTESDDIYGKYLNCCVLYSYSRYS